LEDVKRFLPVLVWKENRKKVREWESGTKRDCDFWKFVTKLDGWLYFVFYPFDESFLALVERHVEWLGSCSERVITLSRLKDKLNLNKKNKRDDPSLVMLI